MIDIARLPIVGHREEILEAVKNNQVVIVEGETGSGKTTGIPQFLYQAGYAKQGIIGVTEPRRIAAIATAKYVAGQIGVEFGQEVGYQIRFDDFTAHGTKIKFMTDGIILREFQVDPDLHQYSVIMVDEAHERSCNIDFTLGLIKDLLTRRPDLKVVVASATIDTKRFSDYFGNAQVINVSGRTYPVDIFWSNGYISDVVKEVANKVAWIHQGRSPGDILVFLTGEDDIAKVQEELEGFNFSSIKILPLYGMQSPEKQQEIFFGYPGKRKVILATNIAETSITIDGVVYIVDSGLIKQMNYNTETGISRLDVVKHSQSGCDQRAGRAGRTQPGICYRMYSEEDFRERIKFTEPEIKRSSLAGVVLAMEDIGIKNIPDFDFLDAPKKEAFIEAYEMLQVLGAIKKGESGLTEIGRAMARLPLAPHISRMVLKAQEYGCVKEVIRVAACLSVRNIFVLPKEKEKRLEAQIAHYSFKLSNSDALTFLHILERYCEDKGYNWQGARDWAYQNFLNWKNLDEVLKIEYQLAQILRREGLEISQCQDDEQVDKAVTAGLLFNLFWHKYRGVHEGVFKQLDSVYIHPGSSLFKSNKQFMVAAEVVRTSRRFARFCVNVKPEWLPELVPGLSRYGEPILKSYNPDTEETLAERPVFFQDKEVGTQQYSVSRDEARAIQEEAIQRAQSEGLELLSFRKHYSEDSLMTIWKDNQDRLFRMSSSYSPKDDEYFYCKVEPFLGDELWANLKFQVYDFNKEVIEPDGKSSQISLQMLAEKFRM